MQRALPVLAGLALASLAAFAAPCAAQDAARTVRFGVQGGVSLPMGDFGDGADLGFLVGALADVRFVNRPVGLRVNADYQRWGGKDAVGDVFGDFTMLSATAAALLTIPTTGGIRPYVLGGLGVYRGSCSEDCEASTDVGFNLGGGLNLNLGTLDTFVELRYHSVDDTSFLPITFGIRF